MRRAQRQEILKMIQTLQQAHDEVKNNVCKRDFVSAQDMLVLCQECAITMGTTIEKSEGPGFATVSILENYCDTVFSVYEELNGSDVKDNKIHKKLKKQLLLVENSVKNDIPIRKEIVFFPYKASMWDSLESVYVAAKENPDCDAYCVPIPYYDKNPDGSFGEMHYEGGEYPDNVEVIDWQTYHFEERKPDVVYIHNPYDNANFVTSVHPRFYASNLIQYTDELVYIPYFVLGEIDPANQTMVDNMKHFCFLPGTVYADKVMLQSENMRQIYINEYMKEAGHPDDQKLREELEKRFLGLGSPKFDKIKLANRNNIPEKWKEKLCTKDGNKKKIIFLNTNVSLILHNSDGFTDNLKRIFTEIEKYSNTYSVIWREHPLSASTIQSMRPQLMHEYKRITEEVRLKEWVVIDDNVEAYMAMEISDCYFGAGGSLITLYSVLGKPMMIADYSYPDKMSDKEISIEGLIRSMGPRLYMNERHKNAFSLFLEKMDELEKMQVKKLAEVKNKPIENAGQKILDNIMNT